MTKQTKVHLEEYDLETLAMEVNIKQIVKIGTKCCHHTLTLIHYILLQFQVTQDLFMPLQPFPSNIQMVIMEGAHQ